MALARPRWIAAVTAVAGSLGVAAGPLGAAAHAAVAVMPGPASLAGRCTTMAGAGRARCRPPVAPAALRAQAEGNAPGAAEPAPRLGFADFAGAYSLYRLAGATEDQRRCRLQPTCSLFAARAVRRFGLLRGLLMGLARAQMEHGDQDGLLPRAVASDGRFIFFDPVERWIHGAL